MAAHQRWIELFTAGRPVCGAVIARITELACSSCGVSVPGMGGPDA